MKHLYKVTYESTAYGGQKSIQTRALFLESPDKVNTYRLGGFQRDSINVLKTEKLRPMFAVELDVDVERNEIMFCVDVDRHIESTLEPWERESEFLKAAEAAGEEVDDYLVSSGFYSEVLHDNTYNYSSDFEDDLDFKIYVPRGQENSDWVYNDDAIIFVRKHYGLDARAGYGFVGIFKPGTYDGFAHFLDFHVRLSVLDMEFNHIDDYDSDYAFGHIERDGYTIKSYDAEKQDVILAKDGKDFRLGWYHPAEGV